ncbi:MAG TPA: TIR domain-containing protein, partial [Candidatus Nanopelagicales bacterium]|nr:TIR domain-containing protein [Candidatus Nanopelagicales bacterium]
ARLESARLILLLISPDFLASEEHDAQVERAMERSDAGSARVVPILLRPCEWEAGRFKKLQPLPRSRKPVTRAGDQDEAFTEIARELRGVVQKLEQGG